MPRRIVTAEDVDTARKSLAELRLPAGAIVIDRAQRVRCSSMEVCLCFPESAFC